MFTPIKFYVSLNKDPVKGDLFINRYAFCTVNNNNNDWCIVGRYNKRVFPIRFRAQRKNVYCLHIFFFFSQELYGYNECSEVPPTKGLYEL